MSDERKDDGGQLAAAMELRDYFAAQVIAGWGEGPHSASYRADDDPFSSDTRLYAERMAAFAYEVADAMLAARKPGER